MVECGRKWEKLDNFTLSNTKPFIVAGFIGEYDCKLDAKGRFLFPAGLRKQVDTMAQERFVMNRGFEGCLVLYPMNEWEKETAKFE